MTIQNQNPSPTRHSHTPSRKHGAGVTLMEMMVVILIILMVLTIAIPSMIGISRGQGVSQGGRIMSSYLLLARGNAIQARVRHRVVFVGGVAAIDSGSSDFAKVYRGYSVIKKSDPALSDSRSDSWSFVEAWDYLPVGIVFGGSSINGLPTMTCAMTLDASVATLNYIEWRPTGLPTQNGTITIVEGFVVGTGITVGTSLTNNGANRAAINFDNFTGRIKVVQP